MIGNNSKKCRIKSYKSLKNHFSLDRSLNTFQLKKENGACYTGIEFNNHLKLLTQNMCKLEGNWSERVACASGAN